MSRFVLHLGDCLDVLRGMPDCSADSVVTDPPYGIGFMGKAWDGKAIEKMADAKLRKTTTRQEGWRVHEGKAFAAGTYNRELSAMRAFQIFTEEWAVEALRVLKPGGHLLCFASTRTYHRMASGVEDAGFEIRDQIGWAFGSGFPKSADVSKAIDKAAGAEREVVGLNPNSRPNMVRIEAAVLSPRVDAPITAPATEAARQWEGWGTALKPAWEPVVVARKPLIGSVAANVLQHGTGGINVDGCRVETSTPRPMRDAAVPMSGDGSQVYGSFAKEGSRAVDDSMLGRWPANLIHDGSPEVLALFPMTDSSSDNPRNNGPFKSVANGADSAHVTFGHSDNGGSAARFFYCAKASKRDRDEGLEHLQRRAAGLVSNTSGQHITRRDEGYEVAPRANIHPTVKPTDLMRWLCRLVTPPGGIVLDPFMGSGSTGKAAMLEGFRFIGIEREEEYMPIARGRIEYAALHGEHPDDQVYQQQAPPADPREPYTPDLFAGLEEVAS